jgi:integrase
VKAKRRRRPRRKRIGKVSYYLHHGAWWLYYLDGERQVRRRIGPDEQAAEQLAAQLNAQVTTTAPTMFSFSPLAVPELCQQFLDHHEHVLRSSVATIRRYRSALKHLEDFAARSRGLTQAHDIDPDRVVRYLRSIDVTPNGHKNAARRKLRDKGVLFILEVCRNLYAYAGKKRHLPPYTENPFTALAGSRFRIEDAKRIFVFDARTELAFLKAAGTWDFPVFFTLAKTGIRSGELIHLLIEDLDLDGGWMHIRDKPDLGWRIKTRRERSIPLVPELVAVLRHVIGARVAGPAFVRERFGTDLAPLAGASRQRMAQVLARRIDQTQRQPDRTLDREAKAGIAHSIWRDAGAVKADRIRLLFIRVAKTAGLGELTCPKSFRHSFATLLQDANVDPLIRQITLGHASSGTAGDALGMTSIYTHTRPETQRHEILRALRLWPESLKLAERYAHGMEPWKSESALSTNPQNHEEERNHGR